jgi:hypothetical protein
MASLAAIVFANHQRAFGQIAQLSHVTRPVVILHRFSNKKGGRKAAFFNSLYFLKF